MRKRSGFSIIELTTGLTMMAMLVLGAMTLLGSGMRSFNRTSSDVTLTDHNSMSLRRMSENLRQAMSVTITNNGKTITYNLPALSGGLDPVTGEKEMVVPITSDGVNRSYTVDFTTGKVTDNPGNRVIAKNIASVDPEAGSTQFNQAYVPFQLTTIGSYRAVTITLITREVVGGQPRYVRMKTTAVVRNSQ